MLHSNEDFLRAIEADPRELTLRLAYADWLTEHDDPRGELISAEEEMRALPVFADRFWELKPRRTQLRTEAGREWRTRMRYGTECEPVFRHGIPDGWRERWRLIREFTERWYRVPMPDVGGRQAEIAEAEKRLGRELPPSVREWVAFASDVAAAPDYSGELQRAHLQPVPDTMALSLWFLSDPHEHFFDSHFAVIAEDLHRADPPVYWLHSELDEDHNHAFVRSSGKPEAPTVTAFALTQAVGLVGGASGFGATIDHLADLYRHLKRSFPSHVKFGEREWDESDNMFVELEPIPGQRDAFRLTVNASAAVRPNEVPDFLWRYARLSDTAYGIFAARG